MSMFILRKESPTSFIWVSDTAPNPFRIRDETNHNHVSISTLDGVDILNVYLDFVFIKVSNRGKGLGLNMMINLIAELKKLGVKRVYIHVLQNSLRAFYRKIGFKDLNSDFDMVLTIPPK